MCISSTVEKKCSEKIFCQSNKSTCSDSDGIQ